MKIITKRHAVPDYIITRAYHLLQQIEAGNRSKVRRMMNGSFSVSVSHRYRLWSRDGIKWQLITHETYNKLV